MSSLNLQDGRYLVTGANGFIGSALMTHLQDRDVPVLGTVRAGSADLGLVEADPLGPEMQWSELLQGVDVIIHTAGLAHVLDASIDVVAQFERVNVQGTAELARQAAAAGVRRFVFLSSIGVNGAETVDGPFTEEREPRPEADYARSKLKAEQVLRAVCADTGMQCVIVRPPLVYAHHAPGNFARLRKLVRSGAPLPLSSIRNLRSLVALENLVDFLVLCSHHPAAVGETFLVSDGVDFSTPRLIELLAEGAGRKPRLWPAPVGVLRGLARVIGRDATFRQLACSLQMDIGKARTILGWQPPVPAEEALRRAGR